MAQIAVVLNGTKENPWHEWGLTYNPFPQIATYEQTPQLLHLAKLGGDPIPNSDHIREHLKGWSQEFVDLCCERFKPGEMVKFTVRWGT